MTLHQAYWSARSMSIQSRRAVKSFHHMKIIIVTGLACYLGLATMLNSRLLGSDKHSF